MSRDPSDAESVFSEPSATFSTLPRGWRARRSGREENVVEGDEGFATFTPSRRQFYSRTLSRDLPLKTEGEDSNRPGTRSSWDASSSNGTLSRPSSASGSTLHPRFTQEPIDRVASMHLNLSPSNTRHSPGALDNMSSQERPNFTSGNSILPSGEALGRVGGHCEQQEVSLAAPSASPTSIKDIQNAPKGKQSMQQLQDLVNELESVPDEGPSNLPEKTKGKTVLKMTPLQLASPKASKSFTSFQKQQSVMNQSGSNPNIVFNVTAATPEQKRKHFLENSSANNASRFDSNVSNEQIKPSIPSVKSASSIRSMHGSFHNKGTPRIQADKEDKIKNQQSKENIVLSTEKTSKNTFIPYNPNLDPNNASHKNLYLDKQINLSQDKNMEISASNTDVKPEKVSSKQPSLLSEVNSNSSDKRNGFVVKATATPDNVRPTWNRGNSFSKVQDQNRSSSTTDGKKFLTVEPYRRGRSEDLKTKIDIVNSSDSSKDTTARGPSKVYRKSKSRDITPAIEAASEKFTQLNSGTLRRISPFEAYRRSKSRELGSVIDIVHSGSGDIRMKSPPPSSDNVTKSEISMSQYEKAKTSIERKFEKSKSPPLELEITTKESPEPVKDVKESLNIIHESKGEREKEVAKDKAVKEADKPKSVYKMITSKFSRSLSNVGEEKMQNKDLEDETNEKDDKFKLKRPSRFLKSKMEKSSSKTSIAEIETKEDEDSDKSEKKSSKKLSNALNKFLGRKTDEVPSKPNKTILPTKSTSAAIIAEKTKKPPRFRTKKFSKSHENLNKKIEDDVEEDDRDVRAKSVVPKAENPDDVTLESATKDICSHLSQIEINITSRIGNMSPSIVTSPSTLNPIQPTSSSSLITSYGLSPALASKRGSAIHQSVAGKLSPAYRSDEESSERKKSYVESSEDGSITPSESMASGLEDIKELEDESVMDRITRKSYYTRFNEMKRKPKSKRIDSRETMDQQLAAAKARLMQEDQTNMKNVRESLSPSRMTPQRSLTTTSPPPAWDGVIRRNSKTNLGPRTTSLPPEDGMLLYGGGMRSPSVHSPPLDDSGRSMRHQSIEREDQHNYYRAPSVPREDTIQYRRQPSINLDDPSNYKRLSSTGREDPSFYLRQPSVPRDEQPPNYRLPSTVKDETPSYRRLSSAMRDDSSAFRRSSLAKEETQNYRRLSSSHFEDKPNDIRLSSVPRDDIAYKRLSSANRDENLGYRTLQYRKSSALSDEPSFNRYTSPYSRDSQEWKSLRDDSTPKSPSLSPSITLNQRSREGVDNSTTENYDRPEVLAVASAAGKAAGAVAAAAASTENSCDASKRIQSPTTIKTKPESAAVVSAREELTRRLTPLTRLSNMGSGDSSSARPYRRTVTSGNLPIGQNELNKIPTVERPTYRRTSTMGLPPTDSSSRTTDYRRILQDPTRRFTGLRSLEHGSESLMTPSYPSRSSFSSYAPSAVAQSYSPPSMNTLLRRNSLYRY